MRLHGRAVRLLIAALLSAGTGPAYAQSPLTSPGAAYPAKAIRFVVGFAPGGPNDTLARLIGVRLTESLAVPVTVDNRPGADSIIGTEIVARAPADGYTIAMVSSGATIHPNVYTNMPYSIAKDFSPVTVLAASNFVVVVNSRLPAHSIKELIALAKARPGQLNFAGSGVGDTIHLAGELFKSMAGVDMHLIAYKGGSPAMTEVVGGQVELMFSPMGLAMPHIKSGRLRALAVTSATRWPTLPEIPSVAEAGVPGYEVTGWYGVLAPGGTPRANIDRLNTEIARFLKLAETRSRLLSMGMQPVGNSPEQMAAHINMELVKWAKVAKVANLSPRSVF
jgi:tripartite-type tricarboxylate transporter receptor subunit TctC